MAQYAPQCGFKRITSDPHYPQANGLAVIAVKTVNTLLDKHGGNDKKFNEELMLCCNVPNKSGTSLAQMFFGHKLCNAPCCPCFLVNMISKLKTNQSRRQKKENKV